MPSETPVQNQEYYPATDKVDWAPLHNALCAAWMFMGVDAERRFYYKHQTTRGSLVVSETGAILDDRRTGDEG